ncbi:MAG: hypothetical protein ABSG97_02135 [Sedimentisphaerales bacterium]|jgi:hypothetical protein
MTNTIKLACLLTFVSAASLTAKSVPPDANNKYFAPVKTCLDNLIEYGTDTYGPVKSPILVSIIDVNTRSCPQNPLPLEEQWRVIRRERRNPAGANLFTDQPLINSMFLMSELTASKTYSTAANNYIDYYLKNLVDKKGLFWWGGHRHYDVYQDKMTGHLENWHEIHGGIMIQWEKLWLVNPDAVKKEIEAIWQWHVINKKTGETNRHDDGLQGCDFPLSSASMIEAFAFLYTKTNDTVWLDRAKLLANYFWDLRNKDTNLIAERPNAGASRFDGSAFATDITGPYCHSLLKTYLMTKENMFKEQAIAYLAGYNKYGFDEQSGKFWGALKLDGSPIPGPRLPASPEPEQFGNNQQYAQYEPRGYLDLWEPYILGSEFPIETAQCYAFAYRITKNPEMLTAAQRFADWIEKTPTDANETEISWYAEYTKTFGKQGTYADKYGRTISFFIDMYALTNKQKYLTLAQKFADEAIAKLYVNGFFKGHPAKPYYESIDGVGCLLYSLEELDQVLKGKTQGLDFDNW